MPGILVGFERFLEHLDQELAVTLGDRAQPIVELGAHAGRELQRASRAPGAAAITARNSPPLPACPAPAQLRARRPGGAVSGASRFGLASASGGGAPSELRRLSFVRSAMILHPVDESLNESVGLSVEAGITGFGNRMAGVLGLAIGRSFEKAAGKGGVARFGDIGPRFPFLGRRADAVECKGELVLGDALLDEGMKLAHRRAEIVNGCAGRLHDQMGDLRNRKRAFAGAGRARR